MAAGYTVESNGDIALTAATAKSILAVINAANALVRVTEMGVSFDGVSSTAEPVTVELCASTQATAGTSTAHTIAQSRGAPRTVQATAARNYTAEPTALTVLKRWLVHPQTGIVIPFGHGKEPEQTTTADALIVRCTAPANVNAQGYLEFEEG
jgi:hypothetical protein